MKTILLLALIGVLGFVGVRGVILKSQNGSAIPVVQSNTTQTEAMPEGSATTTATSEENAIKKIKDIVWIMKCMKILYYYRIYHHV